MQLMKGLPLSLRTELLFHVYKETIRKVKFIYVHSYYLHTFNVYIYADNSVQRC